MTTWQYPVITCPADKLSATLKELDSQGWEAISVTVSVNVSVQGSSMLTWDRAAKEFCIVARKAAG
jgi:hypothetical protein